MTRDASWLAWWACTLREALAAVRAGRIDPLLPDTDDGIRDERDEESARFGAALSYCCESVISAS
ncbi:MAG: hypothetical protein ACRDS9_04390 [Pseudonocardiaceae bacterium]